MCRPDDMGEGVYPSGGRGSTTGDRNPSGRLLGGPGGRRTGVPAKVEHRSGSVGDVPSYAGPEGLKTPLGEYQVDPGPVTGTRSARGNASVVATGRRPYTPVSDGV